MSYDLSVKINSPIDGDDMLNDIIKVMKKILNVSSIPSIIIYKLDNGKEKEVQDIKVGLKDQYFLLGFSSIKDGIGISIIEIFSQPPYTTLEEEGLWSVISVGIKKSNLELILAAVTAIVIATKQNTDINDDRQVWGKSYQVSPREFYTNLIQNNKFSTIKGKWMM